MVLPWLYPFTVSPQPRPQQPQPGLQWDDWGVQPGAFAEGSVSAPMPTPAEPTGSPDLSGTSIHYQGAAGPREGTPDTSGGVNRNNVFDMLRGVQAPRPPEVQKVSTPSVRAPTAVGQSQIAQLLMALGLSGEPPLGIQKLPATLGQALQGQPRGR